jgi:hypothetical protein
MKIVAFTIADEANKRHAEKLDKTFHHFHPDIELKVFGEADIKEKANYYRSTPLMAKKLIDSYDFVNNDYYSDEGSEYLFTWTGKEYFKTIYSQGYITKIEYEGMVSESPTVSILDADAKEKLNNFFGDLWKPVFKQWFKDKTGLDYKTLN